MVVIDAETRKGMEEAHRMFSAAEEKRTIYAIGRCQATGNVHYMHDSIGFGQYTSVVMLFTAAPRDWEFRSEQGGYVLRVGGNLYSAQDILDGKAYVHRVGFGEEIDDA